MHFSYSVTRVGVSARVAQIRGRNTSADRARWCGGIAACPSASADGLGVLLDYAAGVIPASQIRAAGALGSIRYVSDRRPGGPGCSASQWKSPRRATSTGTVSSSCPVTSTGRKPPPTGWAAKARASRMPSAGGSCIWPQVAPPTCPSTPRSTTTLPTSNTSSRSRPCLRGWESVVGHQRTGFYGNSKTIEWALQDGLGSYFWQHNWGSPGGRTHPAAHLHQVEIDKRHVGGVGVDINNICGPQFGQWA
ncbi:MAG: hypothetical protein QOH34_2621 [Mycobacterium sp.]|nr:hypothetical protein [Mycobacterium sp.]